MVEWWGEETVSVDMRGFQGEALGATVNKASEFTHAVALGYENLLFVLEYDVQYCLSRGHKNSHTDTASPFSVEKRSSATLSRGISRRTIHRKHWLNAFLLPTIKSMHYPTESLTHYRGPSTYAHSHTWPKRESKAQ